MKRILSLFLTLVLTAALLSPAALAVNETAAKDRDWVAATARAETIPAPSAAPMAIRRRILCSRSACT